MLRTSPELHLTLDICRVMIKFLPSDITSLQQKLSHLLGEFQDSNTPATRNEIVAIADNLLKRKHIKKNCGYCKQSVETKTY